MAATIKERASIVDANYDRFYEFDPKLCCICSECPANTGQCEWQEVYKRNLGFAVHTNWRQNNNQVKIIYICESPSNRETSHGLPSVGKAGLKIYEEVYSTPRVADWLDKLDNEIY